jgi:hypothetical protein
MGPFYEALSKPTTPVEKTVVGAAAAGAAVGVAVAFANRSKKAAAKAAHQTVRVEDLEKKL